MDQGQKPAGWRKDPTGRHFGRWWDGTQWTENVISAEKVQSTDPMPPKPEPSIFDGQVPSAPARADERPALAVSTAPGPAQRQAAYLILAGAGGVAAGCFLPWATITAPFIGTISKTGIQGDGQVFLLLVAVVVAVTFSFAQRVPANIGVRRWTIAAMLVALGIATTIDVVDISSRFSDRPTDEDFPVIVSIGAGMWLVGIGVIVAAVGWVRMPWRQMAPRTRKSPAASR